MASFQAHALDLLLRLGVKRRLRRVTDARAVRAMLAHRRLPPGHGATFRSDVLDGVPGEWVEGGAPPRGTLLYLHGGGYVAFSPKTHRAITSAYARQGFEVFAPDYRLAPEHPFPAALDDAEAVWHALVTAGRAPGSIVLSGDSAGGGLALALMLRLREGDHALPAAAALLSPLTDMACTGASMTENAARDAMFSPGSMAEARRAYLGASDPTIPLASPLYADLRGLPPLLIHVGDREVLRDDSTRLAASARAAGVTIDLRIWPVVPHVWQIAQFVPEARESLDLAAAFLEGALPFQRSGPETIALLPPAVGRSRRARGLKPGASQMARRNRILLSGSALLAAMVVLARPARRFRDAVAAYIYGYPLVTMEMTRRVMTNAAAVERMRAPMGLFVKARAYPDASFRDAPAPNVDTLYTSAWLDVGRDPWILSLPDMGDRYALFPMLDAWTDVFASPGTRTTGTAAQRYAITGPGWSGTLPADVTEIRSPTSLVWILGRIYCTGTPEDYATVHALQDACELAPLGASGEDWSPPAGTVDPGIDVTTSPRQAVSHMGAAAFFSLLSELMAANPPRTDDHPILARLESLGVVPGRPLDRTRMGRVPLLGGVRAIALARTLTHFRFSGGDMINRNGWGWTLKAGRYGTNYAMRALIAAIGLGANGPEDAIYAISKRDADARTYHGAHRYLLHFPPGRLPPARGFWSVTLYDTSFYLVANPLRRHAISARQHLIENADGSIDIQVAADQPEGDAVANWLPAPRGRFQLMLRMYWPEDSAPSILDGSWSMPPVRRLA